MTTHKTRARARRDEQNRQTLMWVVGTVVFAVLIVGGLVVANAMQGSGPLTFSQTNGHTWGKDSAPVTVEEYADFQCPVCGRAEQTLQQLAATYIDTGKAKVVFHHFAFIGSESTAAAQAAECAGDQGKFFEYAAYLFAHQAGENQGAFANANLKQFAMALNLDRTQFEACFDSGKYADAVKMDTSDGQRRGVKATPTFFFNGKKVEGLLPNNQFAALLENPAH